MVQFFQTLTVNQTEQALIVQQDLYLCFDSALIRYYNLPILIHPSFWHNPQM